jgi:hypothetical protein
MGTVHGLSGILGNVICTCGRLLKQAVKYQHRTELCVHAPRILSTSTLTITQSNSHSTDI